MRGRTRRFRDVLYHGSSGGIHIGVRDVGNVPADWEDAGRISPQGGMETDREDATSEPVRDTDVPSPVGRDIRGGSTGGGDLRHPPSDPRRAIYRNKDHYGPVSGGGAASMSLGL